MSITINGTGSITGLTAGGLPDGSITSDDIASGAVTAAKLAAGAGGKILQVVSTAKTDTFSETLGANTNSSTNCISVTITPASTSSKVLVMITLHGSSTYWGAAGQGAWQGRLVRNGTNVVVGDAAGSRNRVTMTTGDSDGSSVQEPLVFTYLDSPSSTSALTYGVRLDNVDNGSQTLYLNRAPTDTDSSTVICRAVSTITVMEVAG